MNEIIQSLFNRKSVRVFTEKEIKVEDKELILESAIQAPTAGNQVLFTILDIEDQKIKDTLAITCDNQPFIAKAKMVLIFLADCRRWYDSYKASGTDCRTPGYGDLLIACSDALIAAQNTVVAAESLGIGSCYIGDILENHDKHVKLLNLDEFVFPSAMLVFGYPAEGQIKRKKPIRFNKKYIIQKNTYSKLPEADLKNMFKEVHPESVYDFDKYIKAFCERKYMSGFAMEMTESVTKYLKKFES